MSEFGDYFYKLVLIGDSGVGKSCLLSRFTYNEFHSESKSTIGVDFATKMMVIDGKTVKAQIWDTAGQERFKAISRVFYNGAAAAMVTYDMTQIRSFQNVEKWVTEMKENGNSDTVLMLVANKCDLKHLRAVERESAEEFAAERGMLYTETSALNSTNVEEAFQELIRRVHQNMMAKKEIHNDIVGNDFVDIKKIDEDRSVKTEKCC